MNDLKKGFWFYLDTETMGYDGAYIRHKKERSNRWRESGQYSTEDAVNSMKSC